MIPDFKALKKRLKLKSSGHARPFFIKEGSLSSLVHEYHFFLLLMKHNLCNIFSSVLNHTAYWVKYLFCLVLDLQIM